MHRRSVLALAASIPLAGCSAIGLGGGGFEQEIEEGNQYTFDVDAGDYEIVIEVTDAGEPDDDALEDDFDGDTDDRSSASIRIDYDGSPVFGESVEEGTEETFEETFENDGEHTISINFGTANVSIEPL